MSDYSPVFLDEPDVGQEGDIRIAFVAQRAQNCLGLNKPQLKDLSTDPNNAVLISFFEQPEIKRLVITTDKDGTIEIHKELPVMRSNKTIVFQKKHTCTESLSPGVNLTTLLQNIKFWDIHKNSIHHMLSFIDNMLETDFKGNSSTNQEENPVTASGLVVAKKLNSFKKAAKICNEQINGRIYLPLPWGFEKYPSQIEFSLIQSEEGVESMLLSLERSVVEWENILTKTKEDYEQLLENLYKPEEVIGAWSKMQNDYQSFYDQLISKEYMRVGYILKKEKSPYFLLLQEVHKQAIEVLEEAEQANIMLKLFVDYYQNVKELNFQQMKKRWASLLELIFQIWQKCSAYTEQKRCQILLTSINELLINKSLEYLGHDAFLDLPTKEALKKLKSLDKVLGHYDKLATQRISKLKNRKWIYDKETIFGLLLTLGNRLTWLKNYHSFIDAYKILKNFELPTENICHLTKSIDELLNRQKDLINSFKKEKLAVLDVTQNIDQALDSFTKEASEIDRYMGSLLDQVIQQFPEVDMRLKLIELLTPTLERTNIKNVILDTLEKTCRLAGESVITDTVTFERMLEKGHTYLERGICKNKPKIAGMLRVSQSIRNHLNQVIQSLEWAGMYSLCKEEVLNSRTQVFKRLARFDDARTKSFLHIASKTMEKHLAKPLFQFVEIAEGVETLEANFHDDLLVVIIETRELFKLINMIQYPAFKDSFYSRELSTSLQVIIEDNALNAIKHDTARLISCKLMCDSIVSIFNSIRNANDKVEYTIIEPNIKEIENNITSRLNDLTWSDPNADEFVKSSLNKLQELQHNLTKAQNNQVLITKHIGSFQKPLYVGKRVGKHQILVLEDLPHIRNERYTQLYRVGERVKDLVEENARLLNANTKSPQWCLYLRDVSEIIINGLTKNVLASLFHLKKCFDPVQQKTTFLETRVFLKDQSLISSPNLNMLVKLSLLDVVNSIIEDILNQAALIPPLLGEDYQFLPEKDDDAILNEITTENSTEESFKFIGDIYKVAVSQKSSVEVALNAIICQVIHAMEGGLQHLQNIEAKYSIYWMLDRNDFFVQFANYSHLVHPHNIDEKLGDLMLDYKPPTLNMFKELINRFNEAYKEVKEQVDYINVDNWLRMQVGPFQESMLEKLELWIMSVKSFMLGHVERCLFTIHGFIDELLKDIKLEDGVEITRDTMLLILDRSESFYGIEDSINMAFDSLQQIIDALKIWGEEIPEENLKRIELGPERWNDARNALNIVTVKLHPIQDREIENFRLQTKEMEIELASIKNEYLSGDLCNYETEDPYSLINKWEATMEAIWVRIEDLKSIATFFASQDLPLIKDYKAVTRYTTALKFLWDHVAKFKANKESWMKISWKELEVEKVKSILLEDLQDLNELNSELKKLPVYVKLEEEINSFIIPLDVLEIIKNPCIKERHLVEIQTIIHDQEILKIDGSLPMSCMLTLGLHNHMNLVKQMLDLAINETRIEKSLKVIKETLTNLNFTYKTHAFSGLSLPYCSQDLNAALEDMTLKIVELNADKHNKDSLEEIELWHEKLKTTDNVLTALLETQQQWTSMQPIFEQFRDEGEKMNEAAKKFEILNDKFLELNENFIEEPNVIESCTRIKDLHIKMRTLKEKFDECEQVVSNHLEVKQSIFPRFFFLSKNDLKDLFSNGLFPRKVEPFLPKLFENIYSLTYINLTEEEYEEVMDTTATHMVSREGEQVEFKNPLVLQGQVEGWLNHLLEEMRSTLRLILSECLFQMDEKPREQWLQDYPTQIIMAANQINWNSDTLVGFSFLEDGLDNALKECYHKLVVQFSVYIEIMRTSTKPLFQQKLMSLCIMEIHNRDVLDYLVNHQIVSHQSFAWLSQLRLRLLDKEEICLLDICKNTFTYGYEYLGCPAKFVLTPMTDRCFINLTQSISLAKYSVCVGPTGTGKLGTIKDLSRAMGHMIHIYNCSDNMDVACIIQVLKGVVQTGTWCLFSKVDRIRSNVLAVVAMQLRMIREAIRAKEQQVSFSGSILPLVCSEIGAFFTYSFAGKVKIPEIFRSLTRPCVLLSPDLKVICMTLLSINDFTDIKSLTEKVTTFYGMCAKILPTKIYYDWSVRTLTSTIHRASIIKRQEPDIAENKIILQAIKELNACGLEARDFNTFNSLLNNVFPGLEAVVRRDKDARQFIKKVAAANNVYPSENFITKVCCLSEQLKVKHAVVLMGPAGAGKTTIWKMLLNMYEAQKQKTMCVIIEPKSFSAVSLFGYFNSTTKEQVDGLLPHALRKLSKDTTCDHQWMILDGTISPDWAESLGTVMGTSKVLTLASHERIYVKPNMRIILEADNLDNATPSSVSRAGLIYVNKTEIGWLPMVNSWIELRNVTQTYINTNERTNLTICFDKYVDTILEALHSRFQPVVLIPDIGMVKMLCQIYESMGLEIKRYDKQKELANYQYEQLFAFCAIWAFGGNLSSEGKTNSKLEFSNWWLSTFKQIKFAANTSIFDYTWSMKNMKLEPWYIPEPKPGDTLIHTKESVPIEFFLDLLFESRVPIMLIGSMGSGKSSLISNKLKSLPNGYITEKICMNYFTTSERLQQSLLKNLEKRAGNKFAPPGNKKLVVLIDDISAPKPDQYGSVQCHTILRQLQDYGHLYDMRKLELNIILDTQFLAITDKHLGVVPIEPRLQRHFCTFALNVPRGNELMNVFKTLLNDIIQSSSISYELETYLQYLINIHTKFANAFKQTPKNHHYYFNLRHLSAMINACKFLDMDQFNKPKDFCHLLRHETARTYVDQLSNHDDMLTGLSIIDEVCKSMEIFSNTSQDTLFSYFNPEKPDVYSKYETKEEIYEAFQSFLGSYEAKYDEKLLLFDDLIKSTLQLVRCLKFDYKCVINVGITGSCKKTVVKLACHILGYNLVVILFNSTYKVSEFLAELQDLYKRAGINDEKYLLYFETQSDESLCLLNDFLCSGEVPGMFNTADMEEIFQKAEYGGVGINYWSELVRKVEKNLRLAIAVEPIGAAASNLIKKYPAFLEKSAINFYHEWSSESLSSFGNEYLKELLPAELCSNVVNFIVYTHQTVIDVSKEFNKEENHCSYFSPARFIGALKLFKNKYTWRVEYLNKRRQTFIDCMESFVNLNKRLPELKQSLTSYEEVLKKKVEIHNTSTKILTVSQAKLNKEKEIFAQLEEKIKNLQEVVDHWQLILDERFSATDPEFSSYYEVENLIDKTTVGKLKSLKEPSEDTLKVLWAVNVLLAPEGKSLTIKDCSWKRVTSSMFSMETFYRNFSNFTRDKIIPSSFKICSKHFNVDDLDLNAIKLENQTGWALALWVTAMMHFHPIYMEMVEERNNLTNAKLDLEGPSEKLELQTKKLAKMEKTLKNLRAKFDVATDERTESQHTYDAALKSIDMAEKLLATFKSEEAKWTTQLEEVTENQKTCSGDTLLSAMYMNYFGFFNKSYRDKILNDYLWPYLKNNATDILILEDFDPKSLVVDESTIAEWLCRGLGDDEIFIYNAVIYWFGEKYCLFIDPSLSIKKWFETTYKNPEGLPFKITDMREKDFEKHLLFAVKNGCLILVENTHQDVDPLLMVVIMSQGKDNFVYKGKSYTKHPDFHVVMHAYESNPIFSRMFQNHVNILNCTPTKEYIKNQLLKIVIENERIEDSIKIEQCTTNKNENKVELKKIEMLVLEKISESKANLISEHNVMELVDKLRIRNINVTGKLNEAKKLLVTLNQSFCEYDPVVERGLILWDTLSNLVKVNQIYQYSLNAFYKIFRVGIEKLDKVPSNEENSQVSKINRLVKSVTLNCYHQVSMGLLSQKDSLTFITALVLNIQVSMNVIPEKFANFITRYDVKVEKPSPLNFITDLAWAGVVALSKTQTFKDFDVNILENSKRWRVFVENEKAENVPLPKDSKVRQNFERLCIMRTLRPDRFVPAFMMYINSTLDPDFFAYKQFDISRYLKISDNRHPLLLLLAEGGDDLFHFLPSPLSTEFDLTIGENQEELIEKLLIKAASTGQKIILRNTHLNTNWLSRFEKIILNHSRKAHVEFRVLMSTSYTDEIISSSILANSVKYYTGPKLGFMANFHKALDWVTRKNEHGHIDLNPIIFALCYFHTVVITRRDYIPIGWSCYYNFNRNDLLTCREVIDTYITPESSKILWQDLKYLFGNIIYGGYMADDLDRRLCKALIDEYIRPEIYQQVELVPGLEVPKFKLESIGELHTYIDSQLSGVHETSTLYGLHHSSLISYMTETTNSIFESIRKMQGILPQEINRELSEVQSDLEKIFNKIPKLFNIEKLQTAHDNDENPSYFTAFFINECSRMNKLNETLKSTIPKLLYYMSPHSMTLDEENLESINEICEYKVPKCWRKYSFTSLKPLGEWFAEILVRYKDLENWYRDKTLPPSVWLGGLFEPRAFLTSIKQEASKKHNWLIESLLITVDVLRKQKDEIDNPPRDGAYVYGMFLQGASWDRTYHRVAEPKPMEPLFPMLIMHMKAAPMDKITMHQNYFSCPVFETKQRKSSEYVTKLYLKTNEKPSKWILAGSALLLQA